MERSIETGQGTERRPEGAGNLVCLERTGTDDGFAGIERHQCCRRIFTIEQSCGQALDNDLGPKTLTPMLGRHLEKQSRNPGRHGLAHV